MKDLLQDISILTTIPRDSLEKLASISQYCICDGINEMLSTLEDNVCVFDIGIGSLSIKVENNNIYYKFIPSTSLEESLIKTIDNEENPLVAKLEKTLVKRITKTYKELL